MKYRKKPIVIEARKLNIKAPYDVINWCNENVTGRQPAIAELEIGGINISTLEGKIFASHGDYVIKGVKGEFYPCKPDIFELTYDLIEESE
jgi:hypothetical protein